MSAPLGLNDPSLWCSAGDIGICPLVWWCGPRAYVLTTVIGVLCWGALFVAILKLLYPQVHPLLSRYASKIESENEASWFAWNVQSTIHAITVTSMASGPTWMLWSTHNPHAQFDTPSARYALPPAEMVAAIANTSHVFFCYILMDSVIAVVRKAMTLDYLLHHIIFAFFCVLIQYHCFAPFLAGMLLTMEFSTIFLNGFLYLRNRLGYKSWLVRSFFLLFGMTFFVFRLCGTTYITIRFCQEALGEVVAFPRVPKWHIYLISIALVLAVAMQVYWAAALGLKWMKVMGDGGGKAEKKVD